MRDHGGNIDAARAQYGKGLWIDLSTGINRRPYPVPGLSGALWRELPTRAMLSGLSEVAQRAYRTRADVLPMAGAQMAIQLLPRLIKPGCARVLSPTYNEHAACLAEAGWVVETVQTPEALAGADLAVVVNPNNPDGRCFSPEALLALRAKVGTLVVDESFADATPALSVAPYAGEPGLYVLRSFGKFYGLAGLRLGFVLGAQSDLDPLRALAGPWPVSGPAIEIGSQALLDEVWQGETVAQLAKDAARLDTLMPYPLLGGTVLFRLYDVPDAAARVQDALARHHIWSRVFPYNPRWLRLGLPGPEDEWKRVETALLSLS